MLANAQAERERYWQDACCSCNNQLSVRRPGGKERCVQCGEDPTFSVEPTKWMPRTRDENGRRIGRLSERPVFHRREAVA